MSGSRSLGMTDPAAPGLLHRLDNGGYTFISPDSRPCPMVLRLILEQPAAKAKGPPKRKHGLRRLLAGAP